MKNLSIEVTHAISFLTYTLQDINKVCNRSTSTFDKLYKMSVNEVDANSKMRNDSKKSREDSDDDIELILSDFKLFQEDMSDIVKHKKEDTVKYSLRRFRELYIKYKDMKKKIEKMEVSCVIKRDQCGKDKNYIKFIALNKVITPIYQSLKIVEACMYALEHLLDIKKEE